MASAVKRLRKELLAIQKNSDPYVYLAPLECTDDFLMWKALIKGPSKTPYEGGVFELRMEVPRNYPLSPPLMRFITPVFHPNVDFSKGEICLNILNTSWTPAWGLLSVCQAIMALLSDPCADSPLNCDAGNMIRAGDIRAFNSMVRLYVMEYASKIQFPQ